MIRGPETSLGIAILVAGCSASPTIDESWFADTGILHGAAAEFPGAVRLGARFEPPADDVALRAGDTICYGLTLETGSTVRRWLFRLRVDELELRDADDKIREEWLTAFTRSPDGDNWQGTSVKTTFARIEVTSHDADGTPLRNATVEVPQRPLTFGFADSCRASTTNDADTDSMRAFHEGVLAMLSLFKIVENDAMLADMMWAVVRTPSLWGVITSFGVEVEMHPQLDQAVPHDDPDLPEEWRALPTYRFPVEIHVNQEPALLASLVVTEPRAPLGVGAGLVSIVATRPGDPSTRFTMRLLGTRRGEH